MVTPNGSHWLWSWAFAIPKKAKNSDGAKKFAEWATVVLKCIAILGDGSIFVTLAFRKDSVLIAAGYRSFQIHPTAAKRSVEATARLHFFANAKSEDLQLAGELLALHREFTKDFLEIGALHVFCGRAEAFLPVFACFDERVEDRRD